ncbi:MAG: sugar transferase [Anaerovoracaceae bacterium]
MNYKRTFYDKYIKRSIDFILSLLAIIILSPVLLIVAVLVRVKLGSPVIFKQERPGLNEKIFTMYKFRTMTDEKDENEELLSDEIRLTKFGMWLRSASIDELPEIFNILKGDMAIVGPRPLLVKYLNLYNKEQRKRHLVKPGITGYAQVNGRNSISWEEKFDLDVEYVENINFSLDLKVIFNTISTVLKRDGISSDTSSTMEEFTGNNKGRN